MALVAEGILKLHWDQSVPVNMAHLVKQMGVRLQLRSDLTACAQLSITADNQAHITLQAHLAHDLQRYAVAHALGHIALHHLRPGMTRSLHIDTGFRIDVQQRHMAEANDFALRLLMPEVAMRYALQAMHAHDLQELAHLFDVPALLVKQRLADLNLAWPRPTAAPR